MGKRHFYRTGILMFLAACSAGALLTGCATDEGKRTADNSSSTAPDPAWYQSSANPFHAD